MESLYNKINALIQETQQTFNLLQQRSGNQIEIEQNIQEKINLINKQCEEFDRFVMKVPLLHRQNAKMRADQLKYDSKHLQAALASCQQKRQRQEAALYEREQLLNSNFTSNQTEINMNFTAQYQNSLENSNRGIDDMIMTGVGTLESLRSQRMTLKGAHRRIMDMANTLGLSRHTMHLIERHVGQDKYILVGGMVITLLVIILVIAYFA